MFPTYPTDYHPQAHDSAEDTLEQRQATALAVTADLSRQSLGQNGFTYVVDTTAHSGFYVAILALTDATFTALAGNSVDGPVATMVLPAGLSICGQLTSFQLSAGAVVAYKA